MRYHFFTFILLCAYSILHGQELFEKHYFEQQENLIYTDPAKAAPMYNSLMDNYDVKFYKINLSADNESVYLAGDVTILASVVSAELDEFIIELNTDYSIDSILFNETRMPFTISGDDIQILLTTPLTEGNLFTARVFYHGSLTSVTSSFFCGISNNDSYNITYTLSEPLYAKDWFPCKQVLTDKADSIYVFITVDSTLKAGSNGLLTDIVDLGNGKVRYEWKSHYPIAYYLISMTIGEYIEYNLYAHPVGTEDSILIQNYIYDQTYLNSHKAEIDQTADFIEAYSDMFGMYPFKEEKYGHCMAPIGGGMEHQTMTTLSNFEYELVAHELSHMWFGDYVTCGTWQDIWINEGFATYSAMLAVEYLEGEFPTWEMDYYHENIMFGAYSGSIYIPDETFDIDYNNPTQVANLSSRIFDWYLSYEKGAVILHMLRYELQDDELFFQILRTYLEQYQYTTAIGMDFKEVVENESGSDFDWFFDQWYFGKGYPVYRITWNQVKDTVLIEARQGKSVTSAPFFRMNMDYFLKYDGGSLKVRLEQTQATQIFKVPITNEVSYITIDPDHWVLAKIESITQGDFNDLSDIPISDNISVYPNPVSDILNIRTADCKAATLSVFDLSGQCVMTIPINDTDTHIDLSSLSDGIYTAVFTNNSGQKTFKLLKQ